MEANLRPGVCRGNQREIMQHVDCINRKALRLLNDFIEYKESILKNVECCKLFSFNYPLLIRHILREANHYIQILRYALIKEDE